MVKEVDMKTHVLDVMKFIENDLRDSKFNSKNSAVNVFIEENDGMPEILFNLFYNGDGIRGGMSQSSVEYFNNVKVVFNEDWEYLIYSEYDTKHEMYDELYEYILNSVSDYIGVDLLMEYNEGEF